MKKFGRFLFGSAAIAAIGAGAYYAYKKITENSTCEEDDDFIDDLDDFDLDDEELKKTPEYVSLKPQGEDEGSGSTADDPDKDDKKSAEDVLDSISDAAGSITG